MQLAANATPGASLDTGHPSCPAAPQAPGFGERRKALLQDIAIVTGAEFVAKDLGMKVETTTLEQLGVARKLTVANTTTTLIADQVSAGAATAISTAARLVGTCQY